MDEDEINYRVLREIQQMEKNTSALTKLKNSFYSDVSDYLKKLEERVNTESSPQKLSLLKDEMQNIRKIVKSIYEQREKKVLLAVVSKARGGNPNLENMVDVEKKLYDSVLNLLLETRESFLNQEKKDEEKKGEQEEEFSKGDNISSFDIAEGGKEEKKMKPSMGNVNPVVRVKKDIPEFIGTDEKKYKLRVNDVVSLPGDIGGLLLKRGVVEKVELG